MPVFKPADASATFLRSLQPMLDEEVRAGTFPGCVVVAGNHDGILGEVTAGTLDGSSASRRPSLATIYDVASLTKVVVTTTVAMLLCEEQRLSLDDAVVRFWPDVEPAKAAIRVRDLLAHRAGFAAHIRLWERASDADTAVQAILDAPLEYAPGAASTYSDLGMILLGRILEQVAGQTLDTIAAERVFKPLAMKRSFFTPAESVLEDTAPAHPHIRGRVHDQNAQLMGGIAGHAGLFSTAADLACFARVMLCGGSPLIQRETWETFVRRQAFPIASTRALGWDTPSAIGSSAGDLLSRRAFGHTGFTGTSLWIDPDNDLYVVMLSNRVYPHEQNTAIRRLRPRLHDAIARQWIGRKDVP